MKAKIIESQAPGGERHRLADVLPLKTPYLIHLFPIYACNFKCNYCLFSVKKEKRDYISDVIAMDFDLYVKMILGLTEFQNSIKVLRFVGMGEPLLHKDIVRMIEYASSFDFIKRTEILTNGYYLTPDMSDGLIQAGLKRLAVSIQGTSKEKYLDICGVYIELDKFIDNLRYYYENKKSDQILHVKIIDCALDDEKDKQKFYEMFGDCCDTIGVENAGDIFPNVDYSDIKMQKQNQFGLVKKQVIICPQPFFAMYINPEGKVSPCYSMTYPMFLGDVNKQPLYEIWNSKAYKLFQNSMLNGVKNVCSTCADCKIIRHRLFPEDDLNGDVDRIRKYYED